MDKQRALSFLLRSPTCPEEYLPLLREILQDIRSLDEHSTFLFEKVRFLLDATTGRVNITQNKIIKIFSIAAVVFLPPTLVASIYGMNFRFMPELSWPFGYPLAIILMVATGIAPYWYFKHKDWM
jgi:magnesium transporter